MLGTAFGILAFFRDLVPFLDCSRFDLYDCPSPLDEPNTLVFMGMLVGLEASIFYGASKFLTARLILQEQLDALKALGELGRFERMEG